LTFNGFEFKLPALELLKRIISENKREEIMNRLGIAIFGLGRIGQIHLGRSLVEYF